MLNVLIADDDIYVAKSLRALIDWNRLGYEVAADAQNGEEALKLYREHSPDVVITDIRMPVMDGVGLCGKIRESSAETVIIFLSAYEDFETARMAIRHNVTDYITKPMNAEKIRSLSRTLEKIAASYQTRDCFSAMLCDAGMEKEIVAKLQGNDFDYFVAFFDKFASNAARDYAVVLESCSKLVGILYRYLETLGVRGDVTAARREKTLGELAALKRKHDMATFTGKMYFDVLSLSSDRRDGYYAATMEKVKAYIAGHFTDAALSVSSIASEFNYSADYLSKLFGRYAGVTIGTFVAGLRLEKAASLLRDTDISVSELSAMAGYSSGSYFAKVFKKEYGAAPAEYRQNALLIAKGATRWPD
ncbi:MAG: response regulator [Clostridiales bacterium]|nr:response regulator [Clostridiales bacterium]